MCVKKFKRSPRSAPKAKNPMFLGRLPPPSSFGPFTDSWPNSRFPCSILPTGIPPLPDTQPTLAWAAATTAAQHGRPSALVWEQDDGNEQGSSQRGGHRRRTGIEHARRRGRLVDAGPGQPGGRATPLPAASATAPPHPPASTQQVRAAHSTANGRSAGGCTGATSTFIRPPPVSACNLLSKKNGKMRK